MPPAPSRVLIPELERKRKKAMEELAHLTSSGYLSFCFPCQFKLNPTTRLDVKTHARLQNAASNPGPKRKCMSVNVCAAGRDHHQHVQHGHIRHVQTAHQHRNRSPSPHRRFSLALLPPFTLRLSLPLSVCPFCFRLGSRTSALTPM